MSEFIAMIKNAHKITAFRFRRWSRNAAAVFGSIGCFVTIGRLKVSIADASLGKQGNFFTADFRNIIEFLKELSEQKDEVLVENTLLEMCLVGSVYSAENQGCASLHRYFSKQYNGLKFNSIYD